VDADRVGRRRRRVFPHPADDLIDLNRVRALDLGADNFVSEGSSGSP
jgi:hypothetical protein